METIFSAYYCWLAGTLALVYLSWRGLIAARKAWHDFHHPFASRCGQKFASLAERNQHELDCLKCHHRKKDITSLCGQTFNSPQEKDAHQKSCHECFLVRAKSKVDRILKSELLGSDFTACGQLLLDNEQLDKHEHNCPVCTQKLSLSWCFIQFDSQQERDEHQARCPICKQREIEIKKILVKARKDRQKQQPKKNHTLITDF